MARPEKEPETDLGRRLRRFRKAYGNHERAEFAALVALNVGTLNNYELGKRTPDAVALEGYVRLGIDLNWLITGKGEMFADPAQAPASARSVDKDLMLRLGNVVHTAYRKAGLALVGGDNAAEAAELYNELLKLVADIDDERDVQAAMPQLERLMERKLSAKAADPKSSKRAAS